ncbi:MAG: acetyl-CoA carboxylase biotin carboxyl carrier protein subunit, partial [Syntrophothermus sp.]
TEFLSAIMRDEDYLRNRISTGYCDANLERLVGMVNSGKKRIPDLLPVAAHVITGMMPDAGAEDVWRKTGFWRNRIEFQFLLNDQKWNIPVRKNYSCTEILFDNARHTLCLAGMKNHFLRFFVDGESHAAWVSEERSGKTFITIEGYHFEILKDNYLPEIKITGTLGDDKHSGEIISPIPGKVIRVNIEEGEAVERGQTLMIIEAMKMENLIVAPGKGIIRKVYVKVNDRVESASKLLDLEIMNP